MAKLSNIVISYISLVKKGANGKVAIYKSAKEEGKYENVIKIVKSDEEGVIHGIVYTPNKPDSQGDEATAEEIKKACYLFAKSLNHQNVDVEHDFKNVDATIVESYIVKKGDSDFPDDEGAWAVAIQLESDELKELVKSGEITGLSMAGEAIQKADDAKDEDIAKFFASLASVMSGVYIDIHTKIEKGEKVDMSKYGDEVKKRMQEATTRGAKVLSDMAKDVKKAGDDTASVKAENTKLMKEVEALKKQLTTKDEALKKLQDSLKTNTDDVAEIKKEQTEVKETLKKSGQAKPKPKEIKDEEEGIL